MAITDTNQISNLECDYNADAVGTIDGNGFTYNWSESHANGDIITVAKPFFVTCNPLDNTKKLLWWPGIHASGTNPVVPRLGPLCQAAYTMMFVIAPGHVAGALSYAIGAGSTSSTNPIVLFGISVAGKYIASMRGNSGGSSDITSSQDADTRLILVTLRWTSTVFQVWLNGVSIGTVAYTAASTMNQFKLACSPRITDQNTTSPAFARVVFWSKSLNTTELDDAHTFLMGEHGISTPIAGELTIPSHIPLTARPLDARFYWDGVLQRWNSTYSTAHSIPTPSHYADPLTGNDANPGTIGSKYKTVSKGLEQATLNCVHLADGLYPGTSWNNTYTRPERSFAMTADNLAIIANAEDSMGNGWTLETGTTWKTTRTATPVIVVDVTNLNADLRPINLTSRDSIVDCDAFPNSYFDDGSAFVYVNTFDGRQPDYKVVVVIGTVTLRYPFSTANMVGVLKNITFINASTGSGVGSTAYDFANNGYVFDNVKSYFGTEFSFSNAYRIWRRVCEHHGSSSDAFDLRGSARGLHIDCIVSNTGAGIADNGETCHANAVLIACNSIIRKAPRPINHIDSSHSLHLSPTIDGALDTGGADTGIAFQLGTVTSTHTAQMTVLDPRLTNIDSGELTLHSNTKANIYDATPENWRVIHNGGSQPVFPQRRRLMFPGYANSLLIQSGIPLARNN